MRASGIRVALTSLLLLALPGCSAVSSLAEGNARNGSLLFVNDRCLSCHEVNGMGGKSAADLTRNITAADFDLLRYYLEHPPDEMKYVQGLHISDADIHDLNAFANSDLVAQGVSTPTSSDAEAGARLFTTAKCVDCHTVNGVGRTDAPDLTNNPTQTNPDLLKAELDTPPPQMTYVTDLHLTQRQIQELSSFAASSLKPASGG